MGIDLRMELDIFGHEGTLEGEEVRKHIPMSVDAVFYGTRLEEIFTGSSFAYRMLEGLPGLAKKATLDGWIELDGEYHTINADGTLGDHPLVSKIRFVNCLVCSEVVSRHELDFCLECEWAEMEESPWLVQLRAKYVDGKLVPNRYWSEAEHDWVLEPEKATLYTEPNYKNGFKPYEWQASTVRAMDFPFYRDQRRRELAASRK